MTIIATTLGVIEESVENVAQTGFAATASDLGNVITIGTSLLLVIMGLNMLMQIRPMTGGSFFAFAWKIMLISLAAQSWGNFEVIYNILSQVPENLGSRAMQAAGTGEERDLYAALDSMLGRVTEYGERAADESGWLLGAILGAIFFLIAAVFAAVAAGIIAFGIIMFTLMIIIAPAMILTAMFPPTKEVFAAWSRATIGYAMIPLIAGGVLGVIVSVGTQILDASPAARDVTSLATILPFIVVLLLSLGVMATIPGLASNVSGAVGLVGNAAGLSSMANRNMSRAATSLGQASFALGKAAVSMTGAGAALSALTGAATGGGSGGSGGGSSGTPQHRAKYSPGEMIVRMQRLKNG